MKNEKSLLEEILNVKDKKIKKVRKGKKIRRDSKNIRYKRSRETF